ncbi:MAG: DUF4097 family beta strand repeat-containing protein [Chloroflexota bacterium]
MPTEAFAARATPGSDQLDTTSVIDQTFSVGSHCRLVVENPRGQIHVTGWDRPEIHLQATKLAEGSSLARFNATRVDVSHDGSVVIARTILDGGAPLRDRGIWDDLAADAFHAFADLLRNTSMPAEVRYEIQVPRHADLELHAVTSQISVDGVRGTVRLSNVSGTERLDRVQGDLILSTVSGAIDARHVEGYLDARSVSASIRVGGRLDIIKANSVSGSLELVTPLVASGHYDLHTVSGSVTLRLPADAAAAITAQGVSVAVTSDLPCQVLQDARRPGSRRWQGQLNGGGAAVTFRTVSGHLYLTYPAEPIGSADARPTMPPEPATDGDQAPATPIEPVSATSEGTGPDLPTGDNLPPSANPATGESEQLRILRALERGELAVDDALKQLEELRG